MKKIKSILFFIVLCNGFWVCSQASYSKPFFKHSLEYFYPNYYYFDSKFRISLPLINSGVKYTRQFAQTKIGFQTSLFFDKMPNNKATEFGETFSREVLFASVGLNRSILSNNHISWIGSFELNGRFGGIAWLASQNEFESVFQNTPLLDAGCSLGTDLKYRFHKFFISLEIKQTFYFLLYESGDVFFDIPAAPRHNFTSSFGCGFYFGKFDDNNSEK